METTFSFAATQLVRRRGEGSFRCLGSCTPAAKSSMSGEMVPLSSVMSKSQYNQMMMMMSRPRWNATSQKNAANQVKDDFLGRVASAEARDEANRYVAYQRSQREQVYTGDASQPVGGRAARQHKLNSARFETWTDADERAYVKAFGKSSYGTERTARPTGC